MNSIFKMWPDKNFVQGEKNAGGKGHEGSFQVKQHHVGSTGDIIFNSDGDFWDCLDVGWAYGTGGDVSARMVELRPSSQSMNTLTFMELWRISSFCEGACLTS